MKRVFNTSATLCTQREWRESGRVSA